MTLARDLSISGVIGVIIGLITAAVIMAARGLSMRVFTEEAWFPLFISVIVFGFCYLLLRSSK